MGFKSLTLSRVRGIPYFSNIDTCLFNHVNNSNNM